VRAWGQRTHWSCARRSRTIGRALRRRPSSSARGPTSPSSSCPTPTPDLLAEIGRARRGAKPFLLGFAVETEGGAALERAARQKLAQKRVDAIVANEAADALGTDDTSVVIVGAQSALPLSGSKATVADRIVEYIARGLA
jgi:phosphopantothenoylcysteine synthetase/decarboxylase